MSSAAPRASLYSTLGSASQQDQGREDGYLLQQKRLWEKSFERDSLEVRHQMIQMRVEMLNTMNTQATLVAGAIVGGMLSGGEIDAALSINTPTFLNLFGLGDLNRLLVMIYITSATLAMTSSLWVVHMSCTLINTSHRSRMQLSTLAVSVGLDSFTKINEAMDKMVAEIVPRWPKSNLIWLK